MLCVLTAACRPSDKDLVEFYSRDNYVSNGDTAFEAVYNIQPIEIGKVFGIIYNELGRIEICEIIGENRDEWIYMHFPGRMMVGNGDVYKAVNIPDFGFDSFGVTTIEIRGFGIFHRNPTSIISDQSVIDETIDALTSSGDKSILEEGMRINASKMLILLSSNYPGLKYESTFYRDGLGKRYLSKIEDFSRIIEIGEFLDQYIIGRSGV